MEVQCEQENHTVASETGLCQELINTAVPVKSKSLLKSNLTQITAEREVSKKIKQMHTYSTILYKYMKCIFIAKPFKKVA